MIGKSHIHQPCWIGDEAIIGDDCKIQALCYIPGGVTIEDNVFVGPCVCFTNDKYPPSQGKYWMTTLVKKGAAIGANSTIICGVTIGENAFVAAGSIVTKDVPDGMMWVGTELKGQWGHQPPLTMEDS